MLTILEYILKKLNEKGIDTIILSLRDDERMKLTKSHCNSKYKNIEIHDRRSAAYYALGVSQQSQKPVVLLVDNTDADLANILPGIAEAYYQKVPVYIINLGTNEWLLDSHKVIGDKCVFNTIVDMRSMSNNVVLSHISESICSLFDYGGGPVFIELKQPDETIENYLLSKRINEECFFENIDKFKSYLINKKIGVILDASCFYSEEETCLIRTFFAKFQCSCFEDDIYFISNITESIHEFDETIDMIIQIGDVTNQRINNNLKNMSLKSNYWKISPNISMETNNKIDLYICMNWQCFMKQIAGLNLTPKQLLSREDRTNYLDYGIEQLTQRIINCVQKDLYVYGNSVYNTFIDKIYGFNKNIKSISYNDPSGGDGKLSVFIGQCVGLGKKMHLCFIDANDFFRDMNSLHIQDLKINPRICLFCKDENEVNKAKKWTEICGYNIKCINKNNFTNDKINWILNDRTIESRILIVMLN